ncbi:DarT ssDNA thymidine ADP-ribosyltransferase family protein [Butyrivibrio sp. AE2015]|uniref:DarT ssDNA thymidine ADP-ribosyltransferase family protein n=1 Tax=Butyrivibrio sp. AE2015 TaxID=1280663 RepID=UPI0003B79D5A|nr:DarT ssDNA thymidine ADP-ribosyltransferase family protein [Butyrivibrio sp. AE2015]
MDGNFKKKKSIRIIIRDDKNNKRTPTSPAIGQKPSRNALDLKPFREPIAPAKQETTPVIEEKTDVNESVVSDPPKRQYQKEQIIRIGKIEAAFQRDITDDITIIIEEIKTGDKVRGYIKDERQFNIKSEYDDYLDKNEYYVNRHTTVLYKIKKSDDGNRKAYWISPIKVENKTDIDKLEICLRKYYDNNPIYAGYRKIIEQIAMTRDIEQSEIYALINSGNSEYEILTEKIIQYYLNDKIISEATADELLKLILDSSSTFSVEYTFGSKFLEYMSYLIKKFPDKKDVYYNDKAKVIVKKDDEEIITKFIDEYLDKESDLNRISRLIQCLDIDILLRYEKYERYASDFQKSVLEKKKIKERAEQIEKENILDIIRARRIENFIHFTNVKNIDNIMANGLLANNEINSRNIESFSSDDNRFDYLNKAWNATAEYDMRNAICISVSFPNCEMLYRKQRDEELQGERWCIFLIDPKKIIEKNCQYFNYNSAAARFRHHEIFDKAVDFRDIFAENVKGKNSEEIITRRFPTDNEYSKYPTSPQAEITCFEKIELACIKECVFKDERTRSVYQNRLESAGIRTSVNPWYFGYGPYSNIGAQENQSNG